MRVRVLHAKLYAYALPGLTARQLFNSSTLLDSSTARQPARAQLRNKQRLGENLTLPLLTGLELKVKVSNSSNIGTARPGARGARRRSPAGSRPGSIRGGRIAGRCARPGSAVEAVPRGATRSSGPLSARGSGFGLRTFVGLILPPRGFRPPPGGAARAAPRVAAGLRPRLRPVTRTAGPDGTHARAQPNLSYWTLRLHSPHLAPLPCHQIGSRIISSRIARPSSS